MTFFCWHIVCEGQSTRVLFQQFTRLKKGTHVNHIYTLTASVLGQVGSPPLRRRGPLIVINLSFPAFATHTPALQNGAAQVTAASATLYGLLSSTDASFTLLTVNLHAGMSDKYGRRPFMALSTLGLGAGFLITYCSGKVTDDTDVLGYVARDINLVGMEALRRYHGQPSTPVYSPC